MMLQSVDLTLNSKTGEQAESSIHVTQGVTGFPWFKGASAKLDGLNACVSPKFMLNPNPVCDGMRR